MITVLMGAPGAGKTTWVRNNATDELVLSSEAVRIYKEEIDIAGYMNNMRAKGLRSVRDGQSVIVDATNTITAHRIWWKQIAKRYDAATRLIAFNTALPLLLAAQKTREYPAEDHIVKSHFNRFNRALLFVKYEGWGEVKIINRGISE